MKRILYSCFLLTFLLISTDIFSQAFQGTVTPQTLCYNPAGNSGQAGVTVGIPVAGATYSWVVAPPTGGSATQTVVPAALPGTSSVTSITYSGCGQYTLTCYAFVPGNPIPNNTFQLLVDVVCPSPATITSSAANGSICSGTSATLTAAGAASWTWSPGGSTGSTLAISPTVSTCYTVNGTTAQGCSVQANYCLNVQKVTVAAVPAAATICAGITLTLTANATAGPLSNVIAYQWYNTTGAPVALGTNSTEVVSPLINSTYSVLVTSGSCTASATSSITVGLSLSVLPSSSSASVCPGESFTLSAVAAATSAASYTWIAPTTPTTYIVGNPVTFTTGPGIYTVNVSNSTCKGTGTLQIFPTVFTPTITASAVSGSVCPGESFTLTGIGGAPGTYTWASFIPPITLTPITVGPSSIAVTQTVQTIYGFSVVSPGGCSGTASISIGITPPVTVTAVASANSVCASSPVSFTASGAASYTWVSSVTGTIVPSAATITDVPTVATTYSVYGFNASGYCQSAPFTLTVNMITGGTLTLTTAAAASTICPGNTTTLTATGALAYTWSPSSAITTSPPNGSVVVVSPSITTTYTVFGDNNGGCSNTSTINVFVSPIPTLQVVATADAVCAGYTSTLIASGATSYTWTGSTLSTPVYQASISVSPGPNTLTPATYTVYGGSAGANCQSLPVVATVSLAPSLSITVTQDQYTTCITNNSPKYSKPVNLFASGATNYAWFPYNPAYMTYSLGPTTQVRPPTTTQYTIVGSTSVCSGTAYVSVIVIPQFTIDVTPPLPAMCVGDSLRLTIVNIGTLAVGPTAAYTYSWSDPSTSGPTISENSGTVTVLAWPQVTSTYTVQMLDSRQCASVPRLVTVTVLPQPITSVAIPTINNVPTNTVCFVGDIPSAPDNLIDLNAVNGNTGLPFGVTLTYSWSSPYTPTSIRTDPNNAQITVNAPTRLPAVVVYTVQTGYNGIPGCSRIDTVSVRVIDCRPVLSSSVTFMTDVENDTLCSRDCITFIPLTDTVAGGPQTYTWTFQGGSPYISYDKSPVVCYNLPGRYDVTLRVSNPYPKYNTPPGSTGTKNQHAFIRVVDIPNVTIFTPGQAASDTTIKFGHAVVLTATNALSYTWSPPYNISSLTGTVVTVNPIKTTQYIVTGFNSRNCFSRDTVNVIVIEDCGDMYVPNAFSPNGDGVNDELMVRGICLQTLTFIVFDRWGEKVFETTDVNVGWDGTFHGEKINTGVFVYRLEGKSYSGKGFSSKGNITLIR